MVWSLLRSMQWRVRSRHCYTLFRQLALLASIGYANYIDTIVRIYAGVYQSAMGSESFVVVHFDFLIDFNLIIPQIKNRQVRETKV